MYHFLFWSGPKEPSNYRCEHTLSERHVAHAFMSVVVRFCHARITYRNVNHSSHRTMGISHCGKVYSSISASIPTGTVSTSLPLFRSFPVRSLLPLGTWWCHGWVFFFFFKGPFLNDNDSALRLLPVWTCLIATSRDLFQQTKMCRNCQGSKYFHNFIFVLGDTIRCSQAEYLCGAAYVEHSKLTLMRFYDD